MSTQVDLLLERDVDFHEAYVYTDDAKEPQDLEGFEITMEIGETERKHDLILDLDSGISVDPEQKGVIDIYITYEEVNNINWRTGHYQIFFTTEMGATIPFMRGMVIIK